VTNRNGRATETYRSEGRTPPRVACLHAVGVDKFSLYVPSDHGRRGRSQAARASEIEASGARSRQVSR
jgi:hypothetical protein